MQKFLQKKWIGLVVVLFLSFSISLHFANLTTSFLKDHGPSIEKEVVDFLPITIENGAITEPVDTVIEKNYTLSDGNIKIVLDTRVDEFENPASLAPTGIYISRKCFYSVSQEKTQINCMDEDTYKEKIVLDENALRQILDWSQKNVGKYVLIGGFVLLFLFYYLAILLYTVLSHWIIVIWFKRKFSETLYINTLVYALIELLAIFTPWNLNAITRFIILIIANVGICHAFFNSKEDNN